MSDSWPMELDMTRETCKAVLRTRELTAFASVVDALRAQGDLSSDKKRFLLDVGATLNISAERHRAEIRRAANNELLTTVANILSGTNSSSEWHIEGRRLVPVRPRLVPQTAFTSLANNIAHVTAIENAKLLPPSQTSRPKCKEEEHITADSSAKDLVSTTTSVRKVASDITSGKESRKRERSPSFDNDALNNSENNLSASSHLSPPTKISVIVDDSTGVHVDALATSSPVSEHVAHLKHTAGISPNAIQIPQGSLPKKLITHPTSATDTITTALPVGVTVTSTAVSGTTQKVLIVSNGGNSSGQLLTTQRSLTVPIVKTVTATAPTSTVTANRGTSPQIISAVPKSVNGNVATASCTLSSAISSAVSVSTGCTTYVAAQTGIPKIRPRPPAVTTSKQRQPRRGSIVIPVTPSPQSSTNSSSAVSPVQTVQVRPPAVSGNKNTLPIKQDAALKIISQTVPISSVSGTAKILPKPAFATNSGTPVYVMTTSSNASGLPSKVTTVGSTQRVVSLCTKPTATTSQVRLASPSTVTHAKPPQTIHITSQNPNFRALGAKSNLIVVQKGGSIQRNVVVQGQGTKETNRMNIGKAHVINSKNIIRPVANQLPALSQGSVIFINMNPDQVNQSNIPVLTNILETSGLISDGTSVTNVHVDSKSLTGNQWIKVEQAENEIEEVSAEKVEPHVTSIQEVTLPVELPEGRPVTIAEAVELLNSHSNYAESRAALRQAGFEITETTNEESVVQQETLMEALVSTDDTQNLQTIVVHEATAEEAALGHVETTNDEETVVVGHLDPQTGVFTAALHGEEEVKDTVTTDIFQTALASAEILEYVEEENVVTEEKQEIREEEVSCQEESSTATTAVSEDA